MSALSATCWVVTSSTPCTANSSLAAAVMRSSLSCLLRSRRPTGWEARDMAASSGNRLGSYSIMSIVTTVWARMCLRSYPGIYTPEHVEGWRKVVDAVHAGGGGAVHPADACGADV